MIVGVLLSFNQPFDASDHGFLDLGGSFQIDEESLESHEIFFS